MKNQEQKNDNLYTKAADELEQLLNKNNIKFTRESFKGGWAFRFPTLKIKIDNNEPEPDAPDVVIHNYSYGHEDGLFESYQFILDHGDVSGWLTPEDVLRYVKFNQTYRDTIDEINQSLKIIVKILIKINRTKEMDCDSYLILVGELKTAILLWQNLQELDNRPLEKISDKKDMLEKLLQRLEGNK